MRKSLPKLAISSTCLTAPRNVAETDFLAGAGDLVAQHEQHAEGGTVEVVDAGKIDGHLAQRRVGDQGFVGGPEIPVGVEVEPTGEGDDGLAALLTVACMLNPLAWLDC